jgi:small subunit ribosomal protein S2
LKKSLHQVKNIIRCYQKQAKDIVAEKAKAANMPYITERWPGGMLTFLLSVKLLKKWLLLIK